MKKVLFITYYWPPSGKASLHWPLKVIKHLPSFGWKPSVLTVDEDTFSQRDDTFSNEISAETKVVRAKSIEPFDIYRKLIGKSKDDQLIASETISIKNKSFSHRLSIWIRMNLFIPDARVGWYFPALKAGTEYLRQEKIDAVVSIGPPHTAHLIGKKLSSKFSIPHIPVFIDPWVDISYYRNFKRSKLTLSVDNHLEKSVLKNAASVVFVTETMKEDYEKKYSFLKGKSNVLYWGYSEEDFRKI
jgi:glycosyltransferase involved in cell wall biosynthesis